jgi:alpha-amylase
MLHLHLVIHNHQPLGNLPDVFREAYETAYKPFLDVVRKHPGIKWALHSSGCLWEWLEQEEPGYLDILREEHSEGRLEFISGGMWEPIQPLIDEKACRFQFKLMREFLKTRFGVEPSGSWTTERIWEPSLAGRLSEAGIRFTFLDDSQFRAGLPSPDEHPVWGYYRTEHNGRSIAIFPINEHLRYLIPFRKADEVVRYLVKLSHTLPDKASITYGDDGEKFGMWPGTHKWVYKEGWLDRFLGLLEDSESIITTHPSEYLKLVPNPRQRVYIPTSSYREMGVWNLYPKRNLASEEIHKWVESNPRLKSIEPPHAEGLFRTFLARYPESRFMHERVRELIYTILEHDPDVEPSDDKKASFLSKALWHALRAQCNCAYWHGVFGGLYLNYLRFGVHREILCAEGELQKAKLNVPVIRRIGTNHPVAPGGDQNPDAESPVLVALKNVHWVICPETGQVISAGSIEKKVDVIDVLTRRPEAYHSTMVEADDPRAGEQPESIHDMVEVAPPGWSDGHGYDNARRGCFADRIVSFPPNTDQLANVAYREELGPSSGFWNKLKTRDTSVWIANDVFPWHREKHFEFENDSRLLKLKYILSRYGTSHFSGYLLFEFNIGLLAGDAHDRYHLLPGGKKKKLSATFEIEKCNQTRVMDEWTGAGVRISVPDADWMGIYPVKTLSRSESGLEMTYQGTCLVFRMPLELDNGKTIEINSEMELLN